MATQWEDIEDALQAAVVAASQLSADSVRWKWQDIDQHSNPQVLIDVGGAIPIGVDYVRSTYDATRALGQEIKQEVLGLRESAFEIEVFTDETLGSSSARRIAELIRDRFRLDSVWQPLHRLGISYFDASPVNWIPDIPSARFRGRAVCTLRIYLPVLGADEYIGYIARVRGLIRPTGFAQSSWGYSGIAFDTASGPTGLA